MTCESVLEVLREHKDSLMAVLEAFVYDPLLNWRLMEATTKTKTKATRSDSYSGSQETGQLLTEWSVTRGGQLLAGVSYSRGSVNHRGSVTCSGQLLKGVSYSRWSVTRGGQLLAGVS